MFSHSAFAVGAVGCVAAVTQPTQKLASRRRRREIQEATISIRRERLLAIVPQALLGSLVVLPVPFLAHLDCKAQAGAMAPSLY